MKKIWGKEAETYLPVWEPYFILFDNSKIVISIRLRDEENLRFIWKYNQLH
jgi:hypothetical protein